MLRTRAVVALARTTRGGAADHDRTGSERGTRAARWSAMGTYKLPFSGSTLAASPVVFPAPNHIGGLMPSFST